MIHFLQSDSMNYQLILNNYPATVAADTATTFAEGADVNAFQVSK